MAIAGWMIAQTYHAGRTGGQPICGARSSHPHLDPNPPPETRYPTASNQPPGRFVMNDDARRLSARVRDVMGPVKGAP